MANQGSGQSGGGSLADQGGSQADSYNSPPASADLDDEIPF
jgi:hypothetical protein